MTRKAARMEVSLMEWESEWVLGVTRHNLHLAARSFTGFRARTDTWLQAVLSEAEFRERTDRLEHDPTFKQIIPYVVIRFRDQVWYYRRGRSSRETRLHQLLSVGIGGHVTRDDGSDPSAALLAGMQREIVEEVGPELPLYHLTLLGGVNDESNPVGRVHLGIVVLMDLVTKFPVPDAAGIEPIGWCRPWLLRSEVCRYESWSAMILESRVLDRRLGQHGSDDARSVPSAPPRPAPRPGPSAAPLDGGLGRAKFSTERR